ncbi:peptidase MA family protein [Leptospira sp. 96542]|nr:peptidase MA family protein [Leptospira sp. 96542]
MLFSRTVCIVFILIFFIGISIHPQSNPKKTTLAEPGSPQSYDWGNTAPTNFEAGSRLQEPKLSENKLKFPEPTPAYYLGPDGGEVYQWAKGHYWWTKKDGSVFTEWPSGVWKIDLKTGVSFTSYPPACEQCKSNQVWNFPDQTKLTKDWVIHRGEYDWVYRKSDPKDLKNYLLVNQSLYGEIIAEHSIYRFYGSSLWKLYMVGFREKFKAKELLEFMQSEFGMKNQGVVPVILFDLSYDMRLYQGKDLPGGSEEGGFGGQNSITLCCGEKISQSTNDPVLDADAINRIHFGTFYHESVHNFEQTGCLAYKLEAGKTNQGYVIDPWFDEGFANYVESKFYPRKLFYVYDEMEKRQRENKIPKTFKGVLDASYRDLLPYSLGAIMFENLYKTYGKDAVIQYHKETCFGIPSAKAIQNVTGVTGDDFLKQSIGYFESNKNKILKLGKKLQLSGYSLMLPKSKSNFENFLRVGFTLPDSALKIKSIDEIPNVYEIFLADVARFSGKREGDFLGPNETYFYLWMNGKYKWYSEEFEVNVFPGNQIIYRGGGMTIIHWEDGKRKFVASDGTSVMFWKPNQITYYDIEGKQISQ